MEPVEPLVPAAACSFDLDAWRQFHGCSSHPVHPPCRQGYSQKLALQRQRIRTRLAIELTRADWVRFHHHPLPLSANIRNHSYAQRHPSRGGDVGTSQLVRTLLVALAVALVTLGGSGCSALTGESLDRIVERELGISPDPDWDDGPESFDTEEGTVTGTLLMPEGWPSDVPVPSDFEVVEPPTPPRTTKPRW